MQAPALCSRSHQRLVHVSRRLVGWKIRGEHTRTSAGTWHLDASVCVFRAGNRNKHGRGGAYKAGTEGAGRVAGQGWRNVQVAGGDSDIPALERPGQVVHKLRQHATVTVLRVTHSLQRAFWPYAGSPHATAMNSKSMNAYCSLQLVIT